MISSNYTTKFGSVTITSTETEHSSNGTIKCAPILPLIRAKQVNYHDVISAAVAAHTANVSRQREERMRKLSRGRLELSRTDQVFLRSMGITP